MDIEDKLKHQKWLNLHVNGWMVIIPDHDIKPHGKVLENMSVELAWANCPCKPKVMMSGEFPIIIHNSFYVTEKFIHTNI